jgi:hypothetical protein
MTDSESNTAPTNTGSATKGQAASLMILAFGLFGAILVLVTVSVVPGLIVSSSQVPDAAKRLELQNSVRTTLVQGLGVVLLVAGAYFTWRQIQLSREQLRQSLDAGGAQLQLSREGQTTEQFSRAIEQLGHDKAGVRVGAIYALEQIANTSPNMRSAIHELLAAYIRAQSTWSHHDPITLTAVEPDSATNDRPEPLLLKVRAPDVQAAVTVLGRRMEVPGEIIELQNVDLRSAYLGGANLRRAIIGRAMLASADLEKADLTKAWLRRTNFRDADMKGAVLRRAILQDTILYGADLSGADLADADLRNAKFDNATVWPRGFDWQSAGLKHGRGTSRRADATDAGEEHA